MSSNYEILETSHISQSEVKELLESRAKNVEELGYREEKSLEYLKNIDVLSLEDFKKAFDEIKSLNIPRLEENHIIKIIDLLPQDGTQLRAIVSNSGTVLVDDAVSSLLEVLAKYR